MVVACSGGSGLCGACGWISSVSYKKWEPWRVRVLVCVQLEGNPPGETSSEAPVIMKTLG